jgi:RNA polymerase sigma-70 factor (ECF subfamily)
VTVDVSRQRAARPVLDDAELVRQIRARDPEAFRTLYARYARYLAGVVFRLLGADSEIDDVLQDSFVEAVGSLDTLQDAASVRRWLVTIAVRRVHRALLSRHRRERIASSLALIAPRSVPATEEFSLGELNMALAPLPPKLRIPWILRNVEQLELADVAAGCSISVATAKRRIAAADKRIRRWFDAR